MLASQVTLVVKNPLANTGESVDVGSSPGLGISLGVGNGKPLQSSCLENAMDKGVWPATVHGVTKSWTGLSDFTFTFKYRKRRAPAAPELASKQDCSQPGWALHGFTVGEEGLMARQPAQLVKPSVRGLMTSF